ncbi:CBS domain-containing protein [Geoalkalibacter halelectricus]|uniref:CBS domain-containing protein n=1 Tax=Geoalkalibacter halelectricus TaxID=2847045 RepID=UPI003D1CBC91
MSEKPGLRVRDVMTPAIEIIDGMLSISEALALMREKNLKCLLVQKRHPGDEYGLLLLSDIARQVLAKDRAPQRVNVYEIMAKPLIAVRPDMDIRYCARLFDRFDLSRAPVIENDDLLGVVSLTDLVLRGLCVQEDPTREGR